MADSSLLRVIVIVFSVLFFIAALVVNALAGTGKGHFHSTTGNVSARYETLITPAGWTFSIWGLIYTWLAVTILYISTFLCRGYWALCLLPYVFYGNWFASMLMNMIWLLLFDREMMGAALFVCLMLTLANYSTVFFCCYATNYYGLWLQKYYPKDLTCLRIVVQNGLALYATWTSIATLINFTIVLQLWGVEKSTAATASLCILLVELVTWFILENCLLDRWVRYILTVYPVAIVALAGNVARHYHPADPTPNSVFMVILLLLACVLLVVRIIVVIWKRRKHSLYFSSHQPMLSPCDGGKSKIFK